MPDLVLDYHRLKTPIDHPDGSITKAKLSEDEFSTFLFLGLKYGYVHHHRPYGDHTQTLVKKTVIDYSAVYVYRDGMRAPHRFQYPAWGNGYTHEFVVGHPTKDHVFVRWINSNSTVIGFEAVDLSNYEFLFGIDIAGSTFKCFRSWEDAFSISSVSPKFTVTDTTYASGYIGVGNKYGTVHMRAIFTVYLPPFSTPMPKALAVLETEVRDDGDVGLVRELVDVSRLDGLPDHLYAEAKRYNILKSRGYTDEEIESLLGYIPQHQVDLAAVTWGAFDHKPRHSTMIIAVYGDNPYREGAIMKQIEFAKSRGLKTLKPPSTYKEAVEQYTVLKREFTEWLAGKDNYAYQVLGYPEIEAFHVADFYYGELVEHRTHYHQLKRVPEWEMRRTIERWLKRLEKVSVLTEERDKHLNKLSKVMKLGW